MVKISEMLRWAVVEKWMLGYLRSEIASECGISTGAVSSIVDDWRRSTGLELATLIRDLGMTLRRLGISPAQCATGLRIKNLIERMGLDENSIESYLSEVFPKCQELGVNPNYIAKYIGSLISLLDQQHEALSIQEIDSILEKRKQTNNDLEEETKRLDSRLQELHTATSFSERNLEELAEKKESLESDFNWSANLRNELEKEGLNTENLPKLVKAARFFKDSGFSVEEMLLKFSNFKGIENAILGQDQQLEILKKRSRDLEEILQSQDELVAERRLKNRELDELKQLGFGLWDLKILRNLVTELAIENGQGLEKGVAVKRFVSDIESHYADYLRLRQRVNQLRDDETRFRLMMVTIASLGPAVSSFLSRKPSKDDIVEVIKLIESYPKSTSTNFSSNKDQVHSETGSAVIGSAVDSNETVGEKVTVVPQTEIKGESPEENLPTYLPLLDHKYEISPDGPEPNDTSTGPSNVQSHEVNAGKKKVTRIPPSPPPPPLPPLSPLSIEKGRRAEEGGSAT
jgi:hypothetical protein